MSRYRDIPQQAPPERTTHKRKTVNDEWLTAAELAELLQVQPTALRKRRARDSERIPSHLYGGRALYRRRDVEHYLNNEGKQ